MDPTNSGNLNSWTVTVEQDGQDLILPLPQDMLDQVGWHTGDIIEWYDRKDGTWEIRKKPRPLDNVAS